MTRAMRLTMPMGFLLIALFTLATQSSAETYPLEPGRQFSHTIHTVEADLACVECHVGIDTAGHATKLSAPTKEICAKCHTGVNSLADFGITWGSPTYREPSLKPEQIVTYAHNSHLAKNIACSRCHGNLDREWNQGLSNRPAMNTCFNCHNGTKVSNNCSLCHGSHVTLADIHPGDWRHQHGDPATTKREWCMSCHQKQNSCIDCHRGDNLAQTTHPLNYELTHGLDARAVSANCQSCHENQEFCNKCHQERGGEPVDHLNPGWITTNHGKAARADIQSCASCHDVIFGADMTCARSGCHLDFDGVKGTDHAIHGMGGLLNSHGPWHEDDTYFCFTCHTNTRQAGDGFCGYCHGADRGQ
jgi:hypothetical protein